jgi:hypothetical protein
MVGNDAFFKCKLPSFVAEFVSVLSWSDSESNSMYPSLNPGMNTRDCVLKRTCCIQMSYSKKVTSLHFLKMIVHKQSFGFFAAV